MSPTGNEYKHTLVHKDAHCIIVKSEDPRETALADPVPLVAEYWIDCNSSEYNEYRSFARTEDYGKRVFYIYCMADQIVELIVEDLGDQDGWNRPLLVQKSVVMTPLKEPHEVLEHVLFDTLVGKE